MQSWRGGETGAGLAKSIPAAFRVQRTQTARRPFSWQLRARVADRRAAARLLLQERRMISELGELALLGRLFGPGRRGRDAAANLLAELGSLSALASADERTLLGVPGVGRAGVDRWFAALELAKRSARLGSVPERVRSEHDVLRWARPRLLELQHEELWVLCLDARSGLVGAHRVAQGGLLGCTVRPSDVLRPAVRNAAAAIVVVHNHPSGDPTPSEQDLLMTRQLAEACEVMGVPLLDHVVVARGGCRSIAALGQLEAA